MTDANVRASRFLILRASAPCPYCGAPTDVAALAVPAGHECLDEAEAGADWQIASAPALLFHLSCVSDAAAQWLRRLAPNYHPQGPDGDWQNHCSQCGEALVDEDLHCEPQGSFMPLTPMEAGRIECVSVAGPLTVQAAGYTLDPPFVPMAP
jgi:hypothetical protein